MQTRRLNEGSAMPVLGLGTWLLKGDVCRRAVAKALELGYRHIDTAELYGNQRAIAAAIKESGVRRQALFLVSKVWYTNLTRYAVLESCERTLEELQTDYLDLFLIHWPNRGIPISETLEAMQKLAERGLIRALGVSNFTIRHLQEALTTGLTIAVNQIEFHPSLNQYELKEFCDQQAIALTAYSPIAQGEDLKLPPVLEIAKQRQRSPSQVILNWLIQKGMAAIPRSADPTHLADNLRSLEWKLTPQEIQRLDTLNTDNRLINPRFAEFDAP